MVEPPAIMVSNLEDPERVEEAMAAGAKDYLIKSKHASEELLKKIIEYTK